MSLSLARCHLALSILGWNSAEPFSKSTASGCKMASAVDALVNPNKQTKAQLAQMLQNPPISTKPDLTYNAVSE